MSIASAETTMDRIPKHFVTERQGKQHVSYAGLLDYAHRELGLKSIRTVFIQAPTEANGLMAIMWAEVTCEHGVFTGIGDADPNSVTRLIVLHTLRMAETRAKARALRDAANIGGAALEELGPDGEEREEPARSARPADARVATSNNAATPEQIDRIHKLTASLGRGVTRDLTKLTAPDAANIITELVKTLNAQTNKAATKRDLPDTDPAPQEWIAAVGKLAGRVEALGGASTSIPSAPTVGQLRKIKATLNERLAELSALEPQFPVNIPAHVGIP